MEAGLWLPSLFVLLVATGSALLLDRAYSSGSEGPSPLPAAEGSLTIKVGTFTDAKALEDFLEGFLPWAKSEGEETGEWGGDGASVRVVLPQGSPHLFSVEWGPFSPQDVPARLEAIRRTWKLVAQAK